MKAALKRYYACFDDWGDGKPYAVKDRFAQAFIDKTVARFKTAKEAKQHRDKLNLAHCLQFPAKGSVVV